jgi:hypothetical protein
VILNRNDCTSLAFAPIRTPAAPAAQLTMGEAFRNTQSEVQGALTVFSY